MCCYRKLPRLAFCFPDLVAPLIVSTVVALAWSRSRPTFMLMALRSAPHPSSRESNQLDDSNLAVDLIRGLHKLIRDNAQDGTLDSAGHVSACYNAHYRFMNQ